MSKDQLSHFIISSHLKTSFLNNVRNLPTIVLSNLADHNNPESSRTSDKLLSFMISSVSNFLALSFV